MNKSPIAIHLLLAGTLCILVQTNVWSQPTSAFFIETFSGTLPQGWSVIDNAGNGVNWKHTLTGADNFTNQPFPAALSISGSSAGDGYMLYDSDSSGQSVGGEDADLISPRIDCSGKSNVHLAFNQLLVHLNEIARVYISIDSTSWTEVARPSDSIASYTASPNPDFFDIDISIHADSQSAVWVRFNYFGDYDFWWMIDDVSLFESVPLPDLAIHGIIAPESTCSGLSSAETVTVTIENNGTGPAYGFIIGYLLDSGIAIIESTQDTILPGMMMTYDFQTTIDLSLPTLHALQVFISNQNDPLTENDSLTNLFFSGAFNAEVYMNSFENKLQRVGWSISDANGDSNIWKSEANLPWDGISQLGDSCMSIETPTSSAFVNDWLVSPCLFFSDTVYYQISYSAKAENDSCDGLIQLVLLSDSSVNNITSVLSPLTYIGDSIYSAFTTAQFSPAISGIYHIGIHALSAGRRTSLRIDDFRIENATISGIYGLGEAERFTAYPNPFLDRIFVKKSEMKRLSVRLIGLDGKVFIEKDLQPQGNTVLDTELIPQGVYLLEISDGATTSRELFTRI
ncbi:MAG: choice-of-anchor J domain-containing protein [Bacteroidota bacterium]